MAVDVRAALAANMKKTVADQAKLANFDYVFARPQLIPKTYKSGDREQLDCSDGVRFIARISGVVADPAGTDYADYGNSSSIWAHLPHAALSEAEVGDIFTFGYGTGEKHACMAYDVASKTNPGVWNLGTQGQPVFRMLAQEIAGHAGMLVTLCKLEIPAAPHPQTPEDNLRAMTGFYSWAAWKLGEGRGLWLGYGPANPSVRPNVPRLIPPAWWRHYVLFLANRKNGTKPTGVAV